VSLSRAEPGRPTVSRAMLRLVERAVRDFELIRPGDRVAIGVSGGKDSLALAAALAQLSQRRDLPFELTLLHLDQHQPGFDRPRFDAAIAALGLPLEIVSQDTWSVVSEALKPGQIPCALCSRMRRGALNRWCEARGFNRLALGHHLDDALETFFLNLLFGQRLAPLKPLTEASAQEVATIRPLILIEERKIVDWIASAGLEPIPCPVCDSFPDSKRRALKAMIDGVRAVEGDLHRSVREALYGGDARVASLLSSSFDESPGEL